MQDFNRSLILGLNSEWTYCNTITYRVGGGGGLGPDYQTIDQNSKTALSSTSKHGDFSAKSIHQGVAAVVFKRKRLKTLNIKNFCFA